MHLFKETYNHQIRAQFANSLLDTQTKTRVHTKVATSIARQMKSSCQMNSDSRLLQLLVTLVSRKIIQSLITGLI